MFLESICSKTYHMPIAWYKKQNYKMGGPTSPTKTLGGTICPTSNHSPEDPKPMALLLQLTDHAPSNWPSPCVA